MIPNLSPGQVLILDNASFHKSAESQKLVEDAGCKILFLLPYSPDLIPIEKYRANMKTFTKALDTALSEVNSLSEQLDINFFVSNDDKKHENTKILKDLHSQQRRIIGLLLSQQNKKEIEQEITLLKRRMKKNLSDNELTRRSFVNRRQFQNTKEQRLQST